MDISDDTGFDHPSSDMDRMSMQEHWESVYRTRDSAQVSWYQREPTISLAWISEHVPERRSAILDAGAGASPLVDRLLERGYTGVGVLDLSSAALAEVRERLGERAEEVEWFTGDLLAFDPPHLYDLWHDRAVLHFLRDPEDAQRYAETVRRAVKPGGHVLIATFAKGGPTRCSGLEIVQYDCDSLSALLGPEFEPVRDAMEVHRTPGGAEQLFQYCLFQRSAGS